MIIVHARHPENNSRTFCGKELDAPDMVASQDWSLAQVEHERSRFSLLAFHLLERCDLPHDCAECDELVEKSTTKKVTESAINLSEEINNVLSRLDDVASEQESLGKSYDKLSALRQAVAAVARLMEPGESFHYTEMDITVTKM